MTFFMFYCPQNSFESTKNKNKANIFSWMFGLSEKLKCV